MDFLNLSRLSNAKSRSISPENLTGEKGGGARDAKGVASEAARDLGKGWKISPYVYIEPKQELVLADISGSGAIKHIWMTVTNDWRFSILRIYWDGSDVPSVECPVGDFFACGLGQHAQVSSLPVCVNPGSAFNCYWDMPFKSRCKITMENLNEKTTTLFYQIDYSLEDVPEDIAYFHAQFRRVNPVPYKEVYTILDQVNQKGHYVGTYMTWGVNNSGWWGEGEVKFYIDGDKDYPTICGTGTEDYFCGSYNFDLLNQPNPKKDQKAGYCEYTTPYAGLAQVMRPDGVYNSQTRFGMYRWHITDPIRFENDLRVTVQALGWRSGNRYLPLQDDISSVAFWYQTLPTSPFPKLPSKDELEII